MIEQKKIYFRNLDAIRFIAALMVFLAHGISPAFKFLTFQGTFFNRFLETISNGGTGVSIFFVLSGFLITYLLISEHELGKGISVRNFYIRRILRIWPLYFMVVAFSFGIFPLLKSMLGFNNPLGSNVLYHLIFLSNFDVLNIALNCKGSDAMSQNITWSVSVEEQFYLVWPLIFAFISSRFWASALLTVLLSSVVFRFFHHDQPDTLYFHTLAVIQDMGIGGAMALLIKRSKRVRVFFERTGSRAHLVFFVFSFGLLLCADALFSFPYAQTISRLFTASSFALIIAAQAMTQTSSKLALGNWRFASRWGKYTYAIYLVHPIAITIVDVVMRVLNVPRNSLVTSLAFGILAFLITLLLSRLSYRWFESRFLALKDRFSIIRTH